MPRLRNIKLKLLFRLSNVEFEEYNILLKHLKPKPINKDFNSIENLPFGDVVSIRENLANPSFEGVLEVFSNMFNVGRKKFLNLKTVPFFHAINWIKEEVNRLDTNEKKMLTSNPDSKLKSAGIDELNILKESNTLIAIGEKFNTPPFEVERWKYSEVFIIMLREKIINDINQRYLKLK